MNLVIVNGTGDYINAEIDLGISILASPLQATSVLHVRKLGRRSKLVLSHIVSEKSGSSFDVPLKTCFSDSWKSIRCEDKCPWRLFLMRERSYYKLLVLPNRDLEKFLADIPDSMSTASLLLPGTHDTMAFYGWPVSQCQHLENPLALQFQHGIRVIDIRLSIVNNALISFHGIYPQKTPFQDILSTIRSFLSANPSETIIMSLKQEDAAINSPILFSKLVREEMFSGTNIFFLENRIPTLGEVRGKVVFLSRFGGNGDGWEGGLEGLGIHPSRWPDSAKDGFDWQCKETLVRTHDWYAIPSFVFIPEKVALSTEILTHTDSLNITFFSASKFPLAVPPTVAQGFGWPRWGLGIEGVNSRVGKWLLELLSQKDSPRLQGWTLMDYYSTPDPAVSSLLVEFNYRNIGI